MTDAQEAVMEALCIELGFCLLPENDWAWFEAQGPATPDEFARTVWLGEGLDYDQDARMNLKAAVREFGSRYLMAAA